MQVSPLRCGGNLGFTNVHLLQRKIRVRLHGSRLPKDYTIILRMDSTTDLARPLRKGPKRRRKTLQSTRTISRAPSPSDSESRPSSPVGPEIEQASHPDDDTDIQIQKNNAYPGSSNTIGSIHQRRWYLSLDRDNSGFEPKYYYDENSRSKKKTWVRRSLHKQGPCGFEPFYVYGPDIERSMVTNRRGCDVLQDEGVNDFLPRRGWRPVLT